jgi:hypothetical protein
MGRKRARVLSTRVAANEGRLIDALATAEGVTASEAVHRVLVPAVRRRLNELAAGRDMSDEAPAAPGR